MPFLYIEGILFMSDNIFELKNFKEYLPLEVDISDKDCLRYKPVLAPTQLNKEI